MAASPIYGRKFPARVLNTGRFIGGIADYDKEGIPNSHAFDRSVDYRTNPRTLALLPATAKESGSVILDLPKWGDRVSDRITPTTSNTYIYDKSGNIYQRTSAASYSLLRTVINSHGNGMKYFSEDDFLYYTSDKLIGRYGPLSGTAKFTDDFLGALGGVPSNTKSLSLASASSQYYTAADSATLSITSDLTLEVYIDPTTLPTAGNSMTLIGKWDESGALRSYRMDIFATSGYFGDSSSSTLTISVDTTDSPIDSAATATVSTTTISATNPSFASGQVVMIIQMQGSGAGTWMRTTIQGYTAGTITTTDQLNATYTSVSQVLVLKQYSNVTVNSAKTWTAKAWNGTTGGILAFLASGTFTNNGIVSGTGQGFRGGVCPSVSRSAGTTSQNGEGTGGARSTSTSNNGNGGGGGYEVDSNSLSGFGAAGGGHASTGSVGTNNQGYTGPHNTGGAVAGSADLNSGLVMGGAGGAGVGDNSNLGDTGGNGGAIVFISAVTCTNSGTIVSNGSTSVNQGGGNQTSNGGGGAGGSIFLKFQTGTLGTLTTSGASGGNTTVGPGGAGSEGRVHVDYLTSYTAGTVTPSLNITQDNNLVTTTTYQLRLSISNDGTAVETLLKNTSLTTASWARVGITWVASTSLATFYVNGVSLGTVTGTKTAIHDNTSLLYVGANKGASVVQNFYNGLIDDVRVWGVARSASQMASAKDVELAGNETGLKAYYKLNGDYTDTTSNANNGTSSGSPVFTGTVPFTYASTRFDIDQSGAGTGFTYTPLSSISEATGDKFTFVPAKDPQKSIDIKIATAGTGNWTVTIHDALNNPIATATITNANIIAAALNEFTFANPWRPVIGATYHAHVTTTTADGTVTTGAANSLANPTFDTYYQFLVSDIDYHPVTTFLNMIAIGNERWVATWDASSYNPHRLKLPAGHRVRCFAQWNEYLAIGCWLGGSITDYDFGRIFFWDGFSQTYNFYIDVPEGGINAMMASKGILNIIAGYQGDWLEYTTGSKADKVKRLPKITNDKYMEVMPGAFSMWKGLSRLGVAGNSDSTVVERGVYTYGAVNAGYANALSFDYPISTGNRGSTVQVGMILPVDKKLLIGWKDGTASGIDAIDPAGNCYTSGTIEDLIEDWGVLWKEKETNVVRVDFEPLLAGQNIDIKYKLDREASWHNLGITDQAVGDTVARLQVPSPNSRHHEIQIAVDLSSTVGTSPKVHEYGFEDSFLLDEEYK